MHSQNEQMKYPVNISPVTPPIQRLIESSPLERLHKQLETTQILRNECLQRLQETQSAMESLAQAKLREHEAWDDLFKVLGELCVQHSESEPFQNSRMSLLMQFFIKAETVNGNGTR